MYKNLKKKSEGFTIIEVLIVLAIAALIMLIVFIAVPALQRNARNNEIRTQASRLATAAVEFRTNANGEAATNSNVDTLRNMANLEDGTVITVNADGTGDPGAGEFIIVAEAGECTDVSAGGGNTNTRAVAVEFGLEGGGQGCIQS